MLWRVNDAQLMNKLRNIFPAIKEFGKAKPDSKPQKNE
jgi:hypothetical protein